MKRWDIVHARILEVIPLTETFIRLWEEQVVMENRIQDGVMDPHTTMELPQLEQLFRDMKRLMFEKQKIVLTINRRTEDA